MGRDALSITLSGCNHGIAVGGGIVEGERLKVTEGVGGITLDVPIGLDSHEGSKF